MTDTTPHPADALPLPDLSYDDCVSVLGQPTVNDLQLFLNDYIRAAHREGYELAMREGASDQSALAYRCKSLAEQLAEMHTMVYVGKSAMADFLALSQGGK